MLDRPMAGIRLDGQQKDVEYAPTPIHMSGADEREAKQFYAVQDTFR